MKSRLALLTIPSLFLCMTQTHAETDYSSFKKTVEKPQRAVDLAVGFVAGYRSADLQWNIAGQNDTPNVLSELTHDDLEIYELGLETSLSINEGALAGFVLAFSGSYGDIVDGETQDSDFLGNDRTDEFSRSFSDTEGDDTLNLDVSIGYRFDNIEIIPDGGITLLAGYRYAEQNLNLTDGVQAIASQDNGDSVTIINLNPPVPFEGLDSTYEAEWKGPWLGFELFNQLGRHYVAWAVKYYDLEYSSEADWNLREDFAHPVSFTHDADGDGHRIELKYRYTMTRHLSLQVNAAMEQWETDSGTDTTFFSDGTRTETQFNSAEWDSLGVNVGLNYQL